MTRHFVIGDIHGCYDELVALLELAHIGPEDVVVSVGDLVDRGPKPAEVVQLFRSHPNWVVLMGNHERKHVRQVFSYGQEITRIQCGEMYAEIVEWMRPLPYWYATQAFVAVHAFMVPGVPMAEQREEILCGCTAGEKLISGLFSGGPWHEAYHDALPIVYGHHVVGDQPLVREGVVYGIDTGCCHGGRLTGISFPDRTIFSVPAKEDHWKRSQREFQVAVLQTRPWAKMKWRDIESELSSRAYGELADVRAFAEGTLRWARDLHAKIPLVERMIHTRAAAIEAEVGAEHFAAAASALGLAEYLIPARNGRLTSKIVADRCWSPEKLLDLQAKLAP